MVSEQVCQLLTAYVDGELNPRQQEKVLGLVKQSPEAQALLRQLQDNAASLKSLPSRKPARDLSGQVLRSIAERRLQPASPFRVLGPNIAVWASMAAAAAILFAVAVGSYWYFATAEQGGSSLPAVVKKGADAKAEQQRVAKPPDETKPEQLPPPVEIAHNPPTKPPERDPSLSPKNPSDPITTPPQDPKGDQIDKITLRLPETFVLRQLDEPEAAAKLKKELAKDSGYRLELFCLDSAKALARLQASFQLLGVQLVQDAEVPPRLSARRKPHLLLFAEDLMPGEVFKLLQQLGVQDKQAEAKRTGDGQFGKLVVSRLGDLDQKELGKQLGVDPKQLQPVGSGGAGQGSAKVTPGPAAPRRALVIVYASERPRTAATKEMKLFLDSRKPPRPDSVQLMLVLRNAN